jgi:hypothetical protein
MANSRKRLAIGPIAPTPVTRDIIAAQAEIWAGWLNDCEAMHAAWIETMLEALAEGGDNA